MSHQQFASCIEACNACATACDHCANACLDEKDPRAMARCIRLDMDCSAICRLASAAMARGSEQASAICGLCAQICDACADECGHHQMGHCQDCATACRRCAQACRGMGQNASSSATQGATAHAH